LMRGYKLAAPSSSGSGIQAGCTEHRLRQPTRAPYAADLCAAQASNPPTCVQHRLKSTYLCAAQAQIHLLVCSTGSNPPTCVQHRPQIHRRVCSTGSNLKSMLALTAPSRCSSTLLRPRTQRTCVQHRPQACVQHRVRHETVPQETTRSKDAGIWSPG
jgi:hypothetical protein